MGQVLTDRIAELEAALALADARDMFQTRLIRIARREAEYWREEWAQMSDDDPADPDPRPLLSWEGRDAFDTDMTVIAERALSLTNCAPGELEIARGRAERADRGERFALKLLCEEREKNAKILAGIADIAQEIIDLVGCRGGPDMDSALDEISMRARSLASATPDELSPARGPNKEFEKLFTMASIGQEMIDLIGYDVVFLKSLLDEPHALEDVTTPDNTEDKSL